MTVRWWESNAHNWIIADLGPYTGPWPPLAPNWLTLEAFTKDPANWDLAANVNITYATSLPYSDPRALYWDFLLAGDDNILTHAEMGSDVAYDYAHTGRYSTPAPWSTGPNYFWEYDQVWPPSLDGPPRRDGIHLYVLFEWGPYYYADRIKKIVRTLDPLLLAPIGWAANTRGPIAGPDAVWSTWQPFSNHTAYLHDFYQESGLIYPGGQLATHTDWFGAVDTDFDAAFANAAEQLRASIPAGATQVDPSIPNTVPQYQGVQLRAFSDGEVSVQLQAWQYAKAFDVDRLWPDSRIDMFGVRPDNYAAVLDDLAAPPTNYGVFDPYTYDGRGWQWQDPYQLKYLDLVNVTQVTSAGFLNTYDALNAPRPPGLSYRVYAREWTGPETEWLPLDGDAIDLGDYVGPVDPGPGTFAGNFYNVWYQNFAYVNIPFHRVPWRKFWVIQVPSYVFGGPAPSYNDWAGAPVAGADRSWAYISDVGIWGGFYSFTDFHFTDFYLAARYRLPHWRYYKPFSITDTLPAASSAPGGRDVIFSQPRGAVGR